MGRLNIGESAELDSNHEIFGPSKTYYVTYCGMPTSDTFCLQRDVQIVRNSNPQYPSRGETETILNQTPLFYPKIVSEVNIFSRRLRIIEVKPESITLEQICS